MSRADHRLPSVKDVARLAGVSEQTVSRTVHDSPAVRPETKERVRAAIRELGYRPSSAGRSLRRGRYMSLGIALHHLTSSGNLDRLDGFTAAAEERGYAVTLIKMDRERPMNLGQAVQRISQLSVDGMIYVMNRMVDDFRTFEPLPNLPALITSTEPHPVCSTVDCDHRSCSQMMVDYLLDRGHRTVYHIAGPMRSLAAIGLEEGWRRALAQRGIEAPEVLRGDWTPDSGYAAGVRLAQLPDCTAIFAANDAMAYGCMCALRDAGKRVPEDVSVVGVDDDLSRFVPNVQLTSARFDNYQIGRWAIRTLLEGSDKEGPEHKLFQATLVERSSVRDVR